MVSFIVLSAYAGHILEPEHELNITIANTPRIINTLFLNFISFCCFPKSPYGGNLIRLRITENLLILITYFLVTQHSLLVLFTKP